MAVIIHESGMKFGEYEENQVSNWKTAVNIQKP